MKTSTAIFIFFKSFLFSECNVFKKRQFLHAFIIGLCIAFAIEDENGLNWFLLAILILVERTLNFILLRRGL